MYILQGSIWRSLNKATNELVVIKVADQGLSEKSLTFINGRQMKCNENIISETKILKHLTTKKNSPKSIVKYHKFFKSLIIYNL